MQRPAAYSPAGPRQPALGGRDPRPEASLRGHGRAFKVPTALSASGKAASDGVAWSWWLGLVAVAVAWAWACGLRRAWDWMEVQPNGCVSHHILGSTTVKPR
jgi:hypothetical protein